MNAAVKKFRKFVLKRLEILDNELSEEIKKYVLENTSEFDRHAWNDAIINQSSQVYINAYNWRKKKLADHYLKMRANETTVLDSLKILLNVIDNIGTYKIENYELIEFILGKYNFTDIEKAQVYAYFVNSNYFYYKNFRYEGNEDAVREYVLNDIMLNTTEKISKRKLNALAHERLQDFDKLQEEQFEKYLELRFVISSSGDLIPNINAKQFENIFEVEALSQEQIFMILDASEQLAKDDMAKKERLAKKESDKTEARRQIALNQKTSNVFSKGENNKYKEALAKLKTYLKDDYPITFISDEELEEVIKLLKATGYSVNLINEIKKNILLNNQRLLEAEKENKYNIAKEKYLSETEIQILDKVTILLQQKDLLKNSIFKEIEDLFRFVKDQLIIFCDVDPDDETLNDDVSYLLLCIEELSTLVNMYESTNYKLVISKKNSD